MVFQFKLVEAGCNFQFLVMVRAANHDRRLAHVCPHVTKCARRLVLSLTWLRGERTILCTSGRRTERHGPLLDLEATPHDWKLEEPIVSPRFLVNQYFQPVRVPNITEVDFLE